MALPGYDIDPVSKAASLASEGEATISLARLTRMKVGDGEARKEIEGTGMGVGVGVVDGVVLATGLPLPASFCWRGPRQRLHASFCQTLNGRISRGSVPAIYSPRMPRQWRGRAGIRSAHAHGLLGHLMCWLR